MFAAPFIVALSGGILTPPRGVEDAAPYNLVILFTKTLFDRLSNFPV